VAGDSHPTGTRGARGVDADPVSFWAVAARAGHQESGPHTSALAHGCIGLGLVALATREGPESMVPGALWAGECSTAPAGHCGTGPEAPGRLVAARDPWRGPAGRRLGRLVPEGDGTLRQTPSSGHGGSDVTMQHGTTAAAAIGPADSARGGGN